MTERMGRMIEGMVEDMKNRKPNIFSVYFYRWIRSWIELIDSLIGLFTLGIIKPNFSFRHATKQAKKALDKNGGLTEGKMKGGKGFVKNIGVHDWRPIGPPPHGYLKRNAGLKRGPDGRSG